MDTPEQDALRSTRLTNHDRAALQRNEVRLNLSYDSHQGVSIAATSVWLGEDVTFVKLLMPDEIETLISDLQKLLPVAREHLMYQNTAEARAKAHR